MSRSQRASLLMPLRRSLQRHTRPIGLLVVVALLAFSGYVTYYSSPDPPQSVEIPLIYPGLPEPELAYPDAGIDQGGRILEDIGVIDEDDDEDEERESEEQLEEEVEPPPPPPKTEPWLSLVPRELNYSAAIEERKNYMWSDIIYQLRNAPPPSSYPCVPSDSFGPLLLVGVFSTAKSWQQRSVMRALQTRGMNEYSPWVEFKFILGQSPHANETRLIELEQELHGDIVVLGTDENMDDGKTYAFYRWASRRGYGKQPRFVMKADQDTLLIMPNVLASFASLDCSQSIYWGTWWGSCTQCSPLYMRGMSYALSWPLVRWLGAADLPHQYVNGTEDIRTGSWFRSLPVDELVGIVDWKTHMGDWYGGTIPHDIHTVALHAMKNPAFWTEIAAEMVKVWKDAGWEYTWPPPSEDT